MATREEIDAIREKVQAVLHRAQADEEYREQLVKDPEGTLRVMGVPEAAMGEAVRGIVSPEVEGASCAIWTFWPTYTGCTLGNQPVDPNPHERGRPGQRR